MTAQETIVVPLMASDGYYCSEVLPRELARNRRFGQTRLAITPPVGTHPEVPGIVVNRLHHLRRRFPWNPQETLLVLVGHGTKRNPKSRQSTVETAAALERNFGNPSMMAATDALKDHMWADVACAFIDADPPLDRLLSDYAHQSVVVIPLFVGEGPHVAKDLPDQLGLSPGEAPSLPARFERDDRQVIIDRPFGSWPELNTLIVSLAHAAASSSKSWPSAPRPSDHVTSRSKAIRIGTRGSRMAVIQAERVAKELRMLGRDARLVEISTSGDRDQSRPIGDLESASPFTDDVESALLGGDIDLAVHSYKDLPGEPAAGLLIGAVLRRDDPRDALVSRGTPLSELHTGAKVGTSSERRKAQLLALRSDLRPIPIRGAVDVRLRRVLEGEFDAAVLAVAGLERLGLMSHAAEVFSIEQFLPAPGQGALAVQVRQADQDMAKLVTQLDHRESRMSVAAEMAVLQHFESLPHWTVAAYASTTEKIRLTVRLTKSDGGRAVEASVEGLMLSDVLSRLVRELRTAGFDREDEVN
jgi:hydroxymethylbilane synthase